MDSASAPPSSAAAEPRADVAIVGAGPIGLYAAYYAGFRGLRPVIVEAAPFLGGQITAFYPDAEILDAPGFPRVRGAALVERLEEQARTSALDVRLGELVVRIDADGDTYQVITTRAERTSREDPAPEPIHARAVLVAAGLGSFSARRIPDPALARFEGAGLRYALPEPGDLRGRRVLVIGGTPQAAQVALRVVEAGAGCTLIHRREHLAVDDETQRRLSTSAVSFLPCHDLVALEGTSAVERAILTDRRDGSQEEMPVDVVLPCYGFAAHRDALRDLGVTLNDDAVKVDPHMATNRTRIYAAGDGVSYAGKIRLLAVAFGEACTAINHIAADLLPGARVFPGFSSHAHRRERTQRS